MRRQVVLLILMLGPALLIAQHVGVGLWLNRASQALAQGDLQAAQRYLAVSTRLGAEGPAYQRQIARIALLEGRPDDAIQALETANALQPNSRIIYDELVSAYVAAGRLSDAAALLRFLGVTAGDAETKGGKALMTGRGDVATYWFDRLVALDPARTASLRFQRVAAALLAADPRAAVLLDELRAAEPDFPLYRVTGSTIWIPAPELRWLVDQKQWGVTFGSRASHHSPPGTAMLWWTGGVMAVLDVQEPGRYRLRVRALRDVPPPIMLSAHIAGQPVLSATLSEADRMWVQLDTIVTLQPGLQPLVVRFENDGVVDGDNRDATISWVALTPLEP